ncbi:alpha/beta hydrolase [Streptomyces acidicola]|uniref:alpha/beta hydrolase n=1 Tax=Streptomyces acidicola TaxID=2596892 RepID=UPI00378DA7C3
MGGAHGDLDAPSGRVRGSPGDRALCVGCTTGEPRDSLDGFAEGAVEFIEALGLTQVDLLGWSLGGFVAQRLAARRPELVRRIIVAGSGPTGWVPGAPEASEKVLGIMAKPDADLEDTLYLFYPETDAARALGHEHFDRVSTRLAAGGPAVSEPAAQGMLAAVGQLLATPFGQVQPNWRPSSTPSCTPTACTT